MLRYLANVAIALNQLVNTLLGGTPDEMLSARAHRRYVRGHPQPRNAINKLYFWQADHCLGAYRQEQQRKQLGY